MHGTADHGRAPVDVMHGVLALALVASIDLAACAEQVWTRLWHGEAALAVCRPTWWAAVAPPACPFVTVDAHPAEAAGAILRQGRRERVPEGEAWAWADDGSLLLWGAHLWRVSPDGRIVRLADPPLALEWPWAVIGGRDRIAVVAGSRVWIADAHGRDGRVVELPWPAFPQRTAWFDADGTLRVFSYDIETCHSTDAPGAHQHVAVRPDGQVEALPWPPAPCARMPTVLGNAGGWIYLASPDDAGVFAFRPGALRRVLGGDVWFVGRSEAALYVVRDGALWALRGPRAEWLAPVPPGLLRVVEDGAGLVAVTATWVLRWRAGGWVSACP